MHTPSESLLISVQMGLYEWMGVRFDDEPTANSILQRA